MKRGLVKFTFLGIGIFILLFLILFIPNGKSWAGTGATFYNCSGCDDCSAAIGNASAGATIFLNTSLTWINQTCINFGNKSNVIFDCQNYSIQGNGSARSIFYGVYLSSVNNNTIRNCNISSFYNGIELSFSNNSILTNINLTNHSHYGLELSSSNNNTLTNLILNNISNAGLYLQQSSYNNLTGIVTNFNSYGLALQSSSNNNILNKIIGNFNVVGFLLDGSINNTLQNSTFQENSNFDFTNSINSCNNNLINITGSGNRPIGYYNNPVIIQDQTFSQLILCGANNSIINNVTIWGSDSLYNNDLRIYGSSGVIASLVNSSYNYNGINLYSSTDYNDSILNSITNFNRYGISLSCMNATLTNITANNNTYGVYLNSLSIRSILTNITANNNTYGLYLYSSKNNTFNQITTNNNFVGTYLYLSSNNNTLNNSISSNNKYGLYISSSNGTIVSNLTAKNNSLYGVFLESASYNNIITNSFIQLNNGSAFALNNTGSSPQANYFYNNYFNNSLQYSNISTSSVNFFNITKTLGTNIVGGTYLAGNYWAAPNGSGFSQTCTSSTDGICDTSYNFDGINYDYSPLTCIESWSCGTWSTCANSIQTRTCSDANLCQTYKYKPIDSQACISDLGGHTAPSGGGGSSFISTITNITPDKPVEITINNPSMDLNSLILNVKKEFSNSSVNITKINPTTYSLITGLPIGKLYQAFEIEPGISNSNIINATINFKINKTWLADNNITFHYKGSRFWLLENDIVGNVILYRNPDGNSTWIPLATNYSYQDNQSYHLYAYSKGFSTFAIFLNKYDCLPNSARCDNNEVQLCLGNSTWLVTEHCANGCGDRKCASSFFVSEQFRFLSIVIVVAVVIIGLILIFYKKKHKLRKIRKERRKHKKKKRK
ncbi:Periplasmic copper-binding protein (NosD) [uncultured archaeon]|nr:Periplasmic copper-binding protein (NosD) [uncultured archaeon]